jgi:hypothetical protein
VNWVTRPFAVGLLGEVAGLTWWTSRATSFPHSVSPRYPSASYASKSTADTAVAPVARERPKKPLKQCHLAVGGWESDAGGTVFGSRHLCFG